MAQVRLQLYCSYEQQRTFYASPERDFDEPRRFSILRVSTMVLKIALLRWRMR